MKPSMKKETERVQRIGLAFSRPTTIPLTAPMDIPATNPRRSAAGSPRGSAATATIPENAMMEGSERSAMWPE